MVRPTLQPWSAAALLLLLSSALLLSSPAHLVEGLQLPSQASLTGLRIRLQSAFASSPSSSPPSRVLGDAAQVDVPFDYSYFNTFLNSECSPAYVDAQGKPHKASTGFPGSCPRTIPWSDPKIAPAPPSVPSSSGSSSSPLNCSSTPEQVALKWWGTREGGPAVLISWVTCGGSYSMPPATPPATPPPAPPPLDTAAAPPSTLHVGAAPGVYDREVPAVSFSYTVDYSSRFDLSAWQPLSNPPPGPPPTVAAPSLAQEGGGTYISPVVHHALVRGLKPGELVFYRIAGPPSSSSSPLSSAARSAASFSGQFKVPGGKFPLRVGVVSDPGQTFNTSTTFDFLLSGGGVGGGGKKPDVVLMPGDLTYADNSGDWNMYFNWAQAEAISENINPFSPRWDAFGRLVSPLAAAVPILTAPGNHEVEQTPDNALYPVQAGWRNDAFLTRFANYLARYPSPQTTQQALNGPSVADLAATTPSDPDQGRGLYYSTVLPGVATVVSLSTYTFTDSFSASDPMFQWLRRELAAVDRVSTPWLIVQMHASFYSTSLQHSYEVECMRQAYEPLFREFGVDLVFSGHDHDYERSAPTYDYQVDPECGTVYIVAAYNGDEVNYPWIDKYQLYLDDPSLLEYYEPFGPRKAQTCATPTVAPNGGGYAYSPPPYAVQQSGQWGSSGSCVTNKVATTAGNWCPPGGKQPEFSRFRQNSFGAGFLDLLSPTEAVWTFFSQSGPMLMPSDAVVITRGNPKCSGSGGGGGGGGAGARAAAKAAAVANATLQLPAFNISGAAVDAGAGAAGLARGAGAYLSAKKATANFSATTVANSVRNKTGGGFVG